MVSKVDTSNLVDFTIGVGLAVGSTIFIGASFIIKKKALMKINRNGNLRASDGGYGYLKEWMWWAGLITMGIGEIANFAAYAYAPASVVTPLGALSVLVAAILATKFLHERLNLLGKIGCFLCILGSTIIVIHAPKEESVESLEELMTKLQESGFILYVGLMVGICLFVGIFLVPKYGNVNVLVYVVICSSIGSLTVTACKALGLSIRETLAGTSNDLTNWLTWFFLGMVIICIAIQMTYLNKALDNFNTNIVTPVYYVMFTTLVLIASAVLFKEWKNLSAEDILGNVCGFVVIIIAVMLLNSFKEVDVSFHDMTITWRCKREHMKYIGDGQPATDDESGQIKSQCSRQSSYDGDVSMEDYQNRGSVSLIN